MDLRRQEEERIGYNPPPLKEPATFSRPLLPLNSSLLQQHQHTSNPTNRVESTHTRSLTLSPFNSASLRHHPTSPVTWHYKECQRNHAAGVGGHVIDGCCEFMPGDDVTLKCDACGCHRSFHRKELASNQRATHHPFLTPSSSIDHSSSTEEMQISPSKKRFRTKFTSEQKDRMLEFAERLNWRFQKPDDAAIDDFCKEAGLSRQVFKVWMHNNKYIYNKKQDQDQVISQQEGPHEEEPQQQIP